MHFQSTVFLIKKEAYIFLAAIASCIVYKLILLRIDLGIIKNVGDR